MNLDTIIKAFTIVDGVKGTMLEDHELRHELSLMNISTKEVINFNVQPQGAIDIATSANIAVFNMPNGMPNIQSIGPNKSTMSWSGILFDKNGTEENQFDVAKKIESWQNKSVLIKMVFGPIVRNVVVQNFSYKYKRLNLLQYAISVIVDSSLEEKAKWQDSKDLTATELLGDSLGGVYNSIAGQAGSINSTAREYYSMATNVKNNVSSLTRQYGNIAAAPLNKLSEVLVMTKIALSKGVDMKSTLSKNTELSKFKNNIGGL